MKMGLKEFIKCFEGETFKPTKYQEDFLDMIEKNEQIKTMDDYIGHRWYKKTVYDFFTCSNIEKLEVGQTFALATIDGIHFFKKTEFKPINKDI